MLMRELVAELKIERATPHDLRRTCLTTITRLGFGRDAMDRIANHKTSTVTDVYDRHGYADEDKRIMAAVARHVLGLVEGTGTATWSACGDGRPAIRLIDIAAFTCLTAAQGLGLMAHAAKTLLIAIMSALACATFSLCRQG